MFAIRARILIATLWVGSLWTIAYPVAPTLFSSLADQTMAGAIAGRLFRIEAWLSVFCGLTLLILVRFQAKDKGSDDRKRLLWLVGGMLLCVLIGYFSLQPFMSALREAAGPAGVMASAAKTQFAMLHGVSFVFYLIQCLLGVALILKIR